MAYRGLGRALQLLSVAASVVLAGYAPADDNVLDKKDTRVEPTSWGNALGRVYDADTGAPIEGALVVVQQDGTFADKGQTVCQTDALGGYRVRAILGRISQNFDVGRALLSSPIGMLFGSATNTTKRIDVSRLNLSASAPGYKPFVGPVAARDLDASAFHLDMDPILLVREGKQGVSTSASGWGAVRIEAVQVDPAAAAPGAKVKLRAWVAAFGKDPQKTVEVSAACPLWRGRRKLKTATVQADGLLLLEGDYQIGGKEKARVEVVEFFITKSVLDQSPSLTVRPAIVQIAPTPADIEAAGLRSAALADLGAGKNREAAVQFGSLAKRAPAMPFDFRLRGIVCEDLSDFQGSIDSWKEIVGLSKVPAAADVSSLARVLYRGGKFAEVPPVVEEYMKQFKPKELPKKVPADLVAHLGLAYVKLGKMKEADKLNESLLAWPYAGLDRVVIEFRDGLRLAEAEAQLKVAPESALAEADYGRALLDLGRYEEAVQHLQLAAKRDPESGAIRTDLAWAAIHLQTPPESAPPLDQAITDAAAGLNLEKGKQRSKDFFSWLRYSILLYTKAEELRKAGEPTAKDGFTKSIEALRETLSLGRTGAKRNAGMFNYYNGTYLTGSEVAIAGFAYPEANAGFIMLDSLKILVTAPDEPLALANLAGALLELNQAQQAADVLARLNEKHPKYTERLYLSAVHAVQTAQPEAAQELLLKLVAENPRHPRARLLLADLLTRSGDIPAAAEQMAAHAKWYGKTMEIR